MSQPPGLPSPTPEHERLHRTVGTWDCAATWFMPGAEPMKYTAEEVVASVGEFWIETAFKAELGPNSFVGRGMRGFDPARGRYIATWADSTSSALYLFEGTYDDNGALVMTADGPHPMTGAPTRYRSVETQADADHRKYEFFAAVDGQPEAPLFTYELTRRS